MRQLLSFVVDVAASVGLGVASGLAIAAVLAKPAEKLLDKIEAAAYSKVWEAKQNDTEDGREDDDAIRVITGDGEGEALDAVAIGEARNVADSGDAVLVPPIVHDGGLPEDDRDVLDAG